MNLPSKGLSRTEIEERLRGFEKQSSIDALGIEKEMTASFDLAGLADVKEVVTLALLGFMESELKFHSPAGISQMGNEVISMMGTPWGS